MPPDEFQQAWQTHADRTEIKVDRERLREAVELDERNHVWITRSRDLFFGTVTLLTLPLWFYVGAKYALAWTWYLILPVFVWQLLYAGWYRMRYRQAITESEGSVFDLVEESLAREELEIRLQRNSIWWDWVPLSAGHRVVLGALGLADCEAMVGRGCPRAQLRHPIFCVCLDAIGEAIHSENRFTASGVDGPPLGTRKRSDRGGLG